MRPYALPSRLASCALSLLATVSFSLATCQPALAEDFSLGIGAGPDHGKVDCVAAFDCDRSSGSAKVFLGYRWSDTVDLQALYVDAGRFKGGDLTPVFATPFGGTFKVSGFGLSAGYRWQLGQGWSAVARGGLASMRTRFDYADDLASDVSKTKIEPLASLGVAYAITRQWRVSIDYDVTRFKAHNTTGPLQMLGVAAEYAF